MKLTLTRMATAIALVTSLTATADTANRELLLGSVAMDVPATMYKRLSPLTKYLSDEIGQPVALKLSPNLGAAATDLAQGTVDIAYLTPVAYLKARDEGRAQLLVKTITQGEGSFKLMIAVRNDSPIKSVSDLAGKRFAFGDEKAILQRAVVVAAGAALDTFAEYKFIGHYDNIARAVHNGDFDAGILKDTTALAWESKGLRVIHASADLPPYNIAVSSKMDPATVEKMRAAFIKLDKNNPAHQPVLTALDAKYDGFVATSDAEYDVVRQLIAPFNKK